ncbi:MAG: hypothetical protein JO189_26170 [Deltaproteobacteria bacterium]|nr:hypothetical protein [Deltaproteobacteria bacterium]
MTDSPAATYRALDFLHLWSSFVIPTGCPRNDKQKAQKESNVIAENVETPKRGGYSATLLWLLFDIRRSTTAGSQVRSGIATERPPSTPVMVLRTKGSKAKLGGIDAKQFVQLADKSKITIEIDQPSGSQ